MSTEGGMRSERGEMRSEGGVHDVGRSIEIPSNSVTKVRLPTVAHFSVEGAKILHSELSGDGRQTEKQVDRKMNAWLTCLSISVYVCAHSSAVNVKVTRHKQIPLHFNVSTFHLGQNVFKAANGKLSALLSGSISSCLLHGQQSHAALHYSSTSEYHPELTVELFHCAELDLATCAFKPTAPYSIKS